jgi:hypothetical protein
MTPLATGWFDTLILILGAVLASGWIRPGVFPELASAFVKPVQPRNFRQLDFDTLNRNNKTRFDNHLLPRAGVRSFTSGM